MEEYLNMYHNCHACSRIIQTNQYFCPSCLHKEVLQAIDQLKPKNMEETPCFDVFPSAMVEHMNKFLKKDISDLFGCMYYELWNPTVLMSARILENQLKVHIYTDLHIEDDLQSIGACINIMKKANYPFEFISMIDELRDLRNEAMHGEARFGSDEAMNIAKKVLKILAWIYNIPA